MNRMLVFAVLAVFVCSCSANPSDSASRAPGSDYAGQETRTIATLSADDVEELRQGRGWGFAKAAELNGVPGPLHVLELGDELGLTNDQRRAVSVVFENMNRSAKEHGAQFIEAEKRLSNAFVQALPNKAELDRLVAASARARQDLRAVHLSAHLEMVPILTTEQRRVYIELRGYSSADPCAQVPKGHDPTMWKKHNGCAD